MISFLWIAFPLRQTEAAIWPNTGGIQLFKTSPAGSHHLGAERGETGSTCISGCTEITSVAVSHGELLS